MFGPGRQFPGEFPNLYPATVGVILLPFLALRFWVAAAIFSAISAGVLAFGLSKDGYERFPLFVALPFWISAYSQQWSVVFAAAFLLDLALCVYLPAVLMVLMRPNVRPGSDDVPPALAPTAVVNK